MTDEELSILVGAEFLVELKAALASPTALDGSMPSRLIRHIARKHSTTKVLEATAMREAEQFCRAYVAGKPKYEGSTKHARIEDAKADISASLSGYLYLLSVELPTTQY